MALALVSRLLALSLAAAALNSSPTLNSTNLAWPTQTFKTQPTFNPPVLNYTKSGDTAPGYFFHSPSLAEPADGAVIITTDEGELIWQLPNSNNSRHLQLTKWRGQDVLVYWEGTLVTTINRGFGSVWVLDAQYTDLHHVTLDFQRNPLDTSHYDSYIDGHDAHITVNGTLLVTAYNVTSANLTSVGAAEDDWVLDSLVFELDIETSEILWSWKAADHLDQISWTSSFYQYNGNHTFSDPWDWFHINSVVDYGDGVLVSSRHLCSVLYIEKTTGNIIWKLTGPDGGDFTPTDESGYFHWQHDALVQSSTPSEIMISLHNNNNDMLGQKNVTTGLILALDVENMTVSTLGTYYDPENLVWTFAEGNVQVLENFNVLTNHGVWPQVFEYDLQGNAIYNAWYGYAPINSITMESYRLYKYPFVGKPNTIPELIACNTANEETALFMSWNGASEYISWNIYGCGVNSSITGIPRTGFETSIYLTNCENTVQVGAVDPDGTITKSMAMLVDNSSTC